MNFQLTYSLAFAIGLMCANPCWAAKENPIAVSVEQLEDGSHYVMGRFMIDASTQAAWNTLSDYDKLSSFVPPVLESRRVEEKDGHIYVEQMMVGQAGFLRKKILLLLEITETPPLKIEFRDIDGKSFRLYTGSWEIAQWDNGLAITYKLYATPNFFAPNFIADGIFKRDVRNLLEDVQHEIAKKRTMEQFLQLTQDGPELK